MVATYLYKVYIVQLLIPWCPCHLYSFLLWLKYTKLCYTRIMRHGISLRFQVSEQKQL